MEIFGGIKILILGGDCQFQLHNFYGTVVTSATEQKLAINSPCNWFSIFKSYLVVSQKDLTHL